MSARAGSARRAAFEPALWTWAGPEPARAVHLGRECVRVQDSTGTLAGVDLVDGTIEVELAVPAERGFHGVFWRGRDGENFESFFVRPHQVGNPDAVQYTPVFNGVSAWQLYHGPGYWAPIAFPIDEWFRIRVAFAGSRAEVFVGDADEPALAIGELKGPVVSGSVGVFAGGPAVHVAGFAHDAGPVAFRAAEPPPAPRLAGVVPGWSVSDTFPEEVLGATLDAAHLATRRWTRLDAEPSGLVDLARANGPRDGRNTVYARAVVSAEDARTARLDFGFSDRAVAYLNGRALYRGDDGYRTRDYRFLGSVGYHDAVYLPLAAGENELVFAVSEDFGGWGVQARFPDATGLTLE